MPGGSASLTDSLYAKTGEMFYQLAKAANENGDHFPIWGTCLGFELLSVITAGAKHLTDCSSSDRALPLTFQPSKSNHFNN